MVQEAKLIDAKSRNNMYFIEYTVKKPSQEEKHLLSAIALGFNGRQVNSSKCVLSLPVYVVVVCFTTATEVDCEELHTFSACQSRLCCVIGHLHKT